MRAPTIFALAGATIASPLQSLSARQDWSGCPLPGNPEAPPEGNEWVVKVEYFRNPECTDFIHSTCFWTDDINAPPGDWACDSANGFPSENGFYAKITQTANPAVQVLFQRDDVCPPSGPGGVIASLVDNNSCVQINLSGEGRGMTVYPSGGSGLARSISSSEHPMGHTIVPADTLEKRVAAHMLQARALNKRDDNCSGFATDSQERTYSPSKQVSSIVDCTNSQEGVGCQIARGVQHTESISTSYSLSIGGAVQGIDLGATFGMEFTQSTTTTEQDTYTVQAGQRGYLTAYSSAVLFTGRFTGCESGQDQPGTTLAILDGTLTYVVVNTGA